MNFNTEKKYKTVTEALGMLLIFNDPDYSPDYMASKGAPLHEITKKDLQVINIQAVRDICDLLGVPKELPAKSKLKLSKKRRE